MPNRMYSYVVYSVLAVAFFSLSQMPARYFVGLLNAHDEVFLSGEQGRFFSGSAKQLTLAGQPLGAVEWQWSVWRLLLGDLAVSWQTLAPETQISGRVEFSVFDLSYQWADIKIDLDVAEFSDSLRGRLQGSVDLLSLEGNALSLVGQVSWLGAGVSMLPGLNVGDIGFLAQGGTRVDVESGAADTSAPLLKGSLQLSTSAVGYRFSLLKLAALEEADQRLLESLGSRQANGAIQFEGVL